jgi:hypothetical protein
MADLHNKPPCKRAVFLTFTCLVICSSAGIAAESKPAINLDIAKKMVAACEAKAKQEGWKMNIAAFIALRNSYARKHAA